MFYGFDLVMWNLRQLKVLFNKNVVTFPRRQVCRTFCLLKWDESYWYCEDIYSMDIFHGYRYVEVIGALIWRRCELANINLPTLLFHNYIVGHSVIYWSTVY